MKSFLICIYLLLGAVLALDLRSRYSAVKLASYSNLKGSAARRLMDASKNAKGKFGLDLSIAKHGNETQIKKLVDRVLSSKHSDAKKDRMLSLINDHIRRRIVKESISMHLPKKNKTKATSQPAERKLTVDPTYTSSDLQSGQDQSDYSNRLQNIQLQEKAMSNYRKVHTMMDEVDERLEDLRNNVSRELLNMSVGMQRRSMLIGHYNYIGAGLGAPAGGNMAMMDPYFHF